jgi:hypothetical protein
MKKLIVAAVAATMASASMADISIKGDAYLQYADKGIGQSGSTTVVKFFCLFHSSNKLEAGASGFFKPKCS